MPVFPQGGFLLPPAGKDRAIALVGCCQFFLVFNAPFEEGTDIVILVVRDLIVPVFVSKTEAKLSAPQSSSVADFHFSIVGFISRHSALCRAATVQFSDRQCCKPGTIIFVVEQAAKRGNAGVLIQPLFFRHVLAVDAVLALDQGMGREA